MEYMSSGNLLWKWQFCSCKITLLCTHKKGFRATRIMTNYYSTPGPPRELLQKFFSPFLPGSHTPTSMNQKGSESPGHVTESAQGPLHTWHGHMKPKSPCPASQGAPGSYRFVSEILPGLPSRHSSFRENSCPWFTSKAQWPGCKTTCWPCKLSCSHLGSARGCWPRIPKGNPSTTPCVSHPSLIFHRRGHLQWLLPCCSGMCQSVSQLNSWIVSWLIG